MNSTRQKNKGPSKQGHCYAKNHKIVERRIDDTVFLVNPETDTVLYLNQLGTSIWHLLVEPVSTQEVTQTVQHAFPNVPPKKIADDVCELFNQLSQEDFVVLCD